MTTFELCLISLPLETPKPPKQPGHSQRCFALPWVLRRVPQVRRSAVSVNFALRPPTASSSELASSPWAFDLRANQPSLDWRPWHPRERLGHLPLPLPPSPEASPEAPGILKDAESEVLPPLHRCPMVEPSLWGLQVRNSGESVQAFPATAMRRGWLTAARIGHLGRIGSDLDVSSLNTAFKAPPAEAVHAQACQAPHPQERSVLQATLPQNMPASSNCSLPT